jgi:hypothetical protein
MLMIDFSQRRMVNVIVSELVPNSFFSHVFAHSLARIEEGVNLVDVPRPLRGFFGHLCPGCSTKVQGGLSKAPKLNISYQNVEIVMDGWVRAVASIFFKKLDLFRVTVKINANVFPYVNRGRLVADTRISSIDLDVNNIGLGPVLGLFTDDMIQAVNNFVPVHVGPPVKDELRLVFHENGIPLPSICGIRLKQPHVRYIDRALVIEADLDYNPAPLIEHVRKIISGKANMEKK